MDITVEKESAVAAIEKYRLEAEEGVRQAVIQTLTQVRTILIGMTKERLVKRSGALLSAIEGASTQIEQGSGDVIKGTISVGGWQTDARGNPVSKYLPVLFGYKGKSTTIRPTQRMYLAVPGMGSPAYAGNVPIYTPAMLQGDIYRKGQALFTIVGNQFIFALVRKVKVKAKVFPQEAVNEAKVSFKGNIKTALEKAKQKAGLGTG
jgi:hypothetical protein